MNKRVLKIQPYVLLIAFAFYFFTMLSKSVNDHLAKYTDYVVYIAVILCLFLSQSVSKKDYKFHLRYFIVFFVFGVLSLLKTHGGVGSLLGFAFVPLYLCILEKIQFTTKSKRFLCALFSLYIVVLSAFSWHIASNYSWTLNNYISPNTYGLTCAFCFIYSYIFLEDNKSKYRNVIVFTLFILTLYSTFMLDTRMAMYTAVLFFLLNRFVPKKIYSKKRMYTIIILLIIMSMVFPAIYVDMYRKGIDLKIPFTEKSFFTGREKL